VCACLFVCLLNKFGVLYSAVRPVAEVICNDNNMRGLTDVVASKVVKLAGAAAAFPATASTSLDSSCVNNYAVADRRHCDQYEHAK